MEHHRRDTSVPRKAALDHPAVTPPSPSEVYIEITERGGYAQVKALFPRTLKEVCVTGPRRAITQLEQLALRRLATAVQQEP